MIFNAVVYKPTKIEILIRKVTAAARSILNVGCWSCISACIELAMRKKYMCTRYLKWNYET
jgi:hypothetical protein